MNILFRAVKKIFSLLVMLVLLAVIIVAAAVAVVLSDLPQKSIQSVLLNKYGLDVSIGNLEIGWGGKTVIRDLSIRLPIEDQEFLNITHFYIKHTDIYTAVKERNFGIYAIQIPSGQMYLRQISPEKLNIQKVLDAFRDDEETDEPSFLFEQLEELFVKDFEIFLYDLYAKVSASLNVDGKAATASGQARVDYSRGEPTVAKLSLQAGVEAALKPFSAKLEGNLLAEKYPYGHKDLFPMNAAFEGVAGSEKFSFTTGTLELLQTLFKVSGEYAFGSKDLEVAANFSDMKFGLMREYFEFTTDIEGTAAGSVDISMPGSDFEQMVVSGSLNVADIQFYGVTTGTAAGKFRMQDRIVRADQLSLKNKDGSILGEVVFSIDNPDLLDVDFTAERFPIIIEGSPFEFAICGAGDLEFDAQSNSVVGGADTKIQIRYAQEDAGLFDCVFNVQSNVVELEQLSGNFLAGSVNGSGEIILDNLFKSGAAFSWSDIDLGMLAKWDKSLEKLSGLTSGSIKISRSVDNPMEPALIQITTTVQDGIFERLNAKGASFTIQAGENRVMITDSQINCFDGVIQSRARLSRQKDTLQLYISSELKEIDANQFSLAINPQANPIRGKINGSGFIVTSPDLTNANGRLQLNMTELSLFNNSAINTLYSAVNPAIKAEPAARGRGRLNLAFEASRVDINEFYYFDRGIEVRGTGSVADVRKLQQSPVSAVIFGTMRPFRDISLPGAETIDRTLFMLQRDVAAVQVTGTIEQPQASVVSLPDVQSALRRLLSGAADNQ